MTTTKQRKVVRSSSNGGKNRLDKLDLTADWGEKKKHIPLMPIPKHLQYTPTTIDWDLRPKSKPEPKPAAEAKPSLPRSKPSLRIPEPSLPQLKLPAAAAAAEEPEWRRVSVIMTLGPTCPDLRTVTTVAKVEFGVFFQSCFLCKKAIDKDMYMYGMMRAFCSLECREKKMDLDDVVEKALKNHDKSELAAECHQKYNEMKHRSDSSSFKKCAYI